MKIMVGIDLHSNNALCGLMDESGRRLVHKKLACDLPAILQLLAPYKDPFSSHRHLTPEPARRRLAV